MHFWARVWISSLLLMIGYTWIAKFAYRLELTWYIILSRPLISYMQLVLLFKSNLKTNVIFRQWLSPAADGGDNWWH